jgi:chromate transporter
MSDPVTLWHLVLVFAQLSLLAFGGANAIIPEMHRQVVDVHGWLGGREFVALYALAQAAPGPNLMVVSLIGWRVSGLAGAVAATLAVGVPSSVLVLLVSGMWYRFRDAPWRKATQAGLMPVTAGVIMAGAGLFIQEAAAGWGTMAVIAVALPVFLFTRLHPLLILGTAAALGALGAS